MKMAAFFLPELLLEKVHIILWSAYWWTWCQHNTVHSNNEETYFCSEPHSFWFHFNAIGEGIWENIPENRASENFSNFLSFENSIMSYVTSYYFYQDSHSMKFVQQLYLDFTQVFVFQDRYIRNGKCIAA